MAAGSFSVNLFLEGSRGRDYLYSFDGNDQIFGDSFEAAYDLEVASQVYRLYHAALDRKPDVLGHESWTKRIASGETSLIDVARGFINSPQFRNNYSEAGSNEDFVTQLYSNVLERFPDSSGLAHWVEVLESGTGRAEVVLGFSQSPQFISKTELSAIKYSLTHMPSEWSDEVFRLYQATLNRAPDLTGQSNWSERLASGDFTLLEVANGFVRSPQFLKTYEALDDGKFISLLYNNVLGRMPDANGFQRWTTELSNGTSRAEVVIGFSQSPQFVASSTNNLKKWMRNQDVDDIIDAGGGKNSVAGGELVDMFVFKEEDDGNTTVLDLEVWDMIYFSGFSYSNTSQVFSEFVQVGGDIVFDDQGVKVTFKNTTIESITDDMILL